MPLGGFSRASMIPKDLLTVRALRARHCQLNFGIVPVFSFCLAHGKGLLEMGGSAVVKQDSM
jgi:hypothetical protein